MMDKIKTKISGNKKNIAKISAGTLLLLVLFQF